MPKRTVQQIAISTAGSVDLIAAPGGNLRIYVVNFVLTAAAAATAKFTSGTGPTDLGAPFDFAALGGLVVGNGDGVVMQTNLPNEKLSIVVTGTGPVHGFLRYFIGAGR